MAKNTASTAFRKIDVDQYNEDNYRDDQSNDIQSPVGGPDENEVNSLINIGRNIDALKLVLRSAPIGSENQHLKDSSLNIILRVLLSFKIGQVEEAVAALDREQIDLLMKYIYRGFEIPSEGSSAHLLLWHEKVFAVGGLGAIVRVLTDKKRV